MRTNKISAKVVADSKNQSGDRLTTMEIVIPRMILAELNTHRMFTRNSASSRAIPFKKMKREVTENLFTPIAFQKSHSGMQGTEYFEGFQDTVRVFAWKLASKMAILGSSILFKLGVTKQLANRILEPFMYHRVLLSFTESGNFLNLRSPDYQFKTSYGDIHYKSKKHFLAFVPLPDEAKNYDNWTDLDWLKRNKGMSEIHIMDLAEKMVDALNESIPKKLKGGDWHVPYGEDFDYEKLGEITSQYYKDNPEEIVDVQKWTNQIAIARCARLSYQTLGDNPVIDYEKDLALYKSLKDSGHFSPFEHVAKSIGPEGYREFSRSTPGRVEYGWCLNFRGFIQERFLLENSLFEISKLKNS